MTRSSNGLTINLDLKIERTLRLKKRNHLRFKGIGDHQVVKEVKISGGEEIIE